MDKTVAFRTLAARNTDISSTECNSGTTKNCPFAGKKKCKGLPTTRRGDPRGSG